MSPVAVDGQQAMEMFSSTFEHIQRGVGEMKATRTVVVVYEDTVTRREAIKFCDHLVGRYWSQGEFEVSWWPFTNLHEASSCKEVTEKAIVADLVVFAGRPDSALSPELKAWMETWLHQRGDREGVLAGLFGAGTETADKHVYFRNVAHRGGMDYLTEIPQDLAHSVPDSPESYTERAHRVTGVLENILRQKSPPRTII